MLEKWPYYTKEHVVCEKCGHTVSDNTAVCPCCSREIYNEEN